MNQLTQQLKDGTMEIHEVPTTFFLDDAPKAYQMFVEKSENNVGIVIEYSDKADITKKVI